MLFQLLLHSLSRADSILIDPVVHAIHLFLDQNRLFHLLDGELLHGHHELIFVELFVSISVIAGDEIFQLSLETLSLFDSHQGILIRR